MSMKKHYFNNLELAAMLAVSDAIEIAPVHMDENGCCEVSNEENASMYSVYVHYDTSKTSRCGVECIADFDTKEEAFKYARPFALPIYENYQN